MEKKNERIFLLVDGSAILHRAYHAMPPFKTRKGVPTGAVFGFFSMLLKLLQELKPSYVAVAFDRPKPTFRQVLYVGYQAQRPKVSDELAEQFKIVHEILNKVSISVYEVDGFEADDIIGTIASQAVGLRPTVYSKRKKTVVSSRKAVDTVIIVSGDRDMLQLINDSVKVLMPVKGISEVMIFDEKRVEEKYGVLPKQIIDYKALIGDPSDNYPGVNGVGPKTAAELIGKYKTFENIYRHVGELPPKIANALSMEVEQAELAKKLATIVTDVPLSFSTDECDTKKITEAKLREAFKPYGFKSLIKRLDDVFGADPDLIGGARLQFGPERFDSPELTVEGLTAEGLDRRGTKQKTTSPKKRRNQMKLL